MNVNRDHFLFVCLSNRYRYFQLFNVKITNAFFPTFIFVRARKGNSKITQKKNQNQFPCEGYRHMNGEIESENRSNE